MKSALKLTDLLSLVIGFSTLLISECMTRPAVPNNLKLKETKIKNNKRLSLQIQQLLGLYTVIEDSGNHRKKPFKLVPCFLSVGGSKLEDFRENTSLKTIQDDPLRLESSDRIAVCPKWRFAVIAA